VSLRGAPGRRGVGPRGRGWAGDRGRAGHAAAPRGRAGSRRRRRGPPAVNRGVAPRDLGRGGAFATGPRLSHPPAVAKRSGARGVRVGAARAGLARGGGGGGAGGGGRRRGGGGGEGGRLRDLVTRAGAVCPAPALGKAGAGSDGRTLAPRQADEPRSELAIARAGRASGGGAAGAPGAPMRDHPPRRSRRRRLPCRGGRGRVVMGPRGRPSTTASVEADLSRPTLVRLHPTLFEERLRTSGRGAQAQGS
jgi:hypothetical protein